MINMWMEIKMDFVERFEIFHYYFQRTDVYFSYVVLTWKFAVDSWQRYWGNLHD